jgi:hypothetical protein
MVTRAEQRAAAHPAPAPNLPRLWTARELAAHYKVDQRTVRRWARAGVLEVVQIGPRTCRRYRRPEDRQPP